MKRKQAFAFNAPGATCNYLSLSQSASIRNGGYACNPIEQYEVRQAIDYTFMRNRGSIRKKLKPLMEYNPDIDCFKLGALDYHTTKSRFVYFFYGYRIVVEFFDENAIVDFTGPLEEGAEREPARDKFLQIFRDFKCSKIGEFLIDIRL